MNTNCQQNQSHRQSDPTLCIHFLLSAAYKKKRFFFFIIQSVSRREFELVYCFNDYFCNMNSISFWIYVYSKYNIQIDKNLFDLHDNFLFNRRLFKMKKKMERLEIL
jgi:hypothetical protein